MVQLQGDEGPSGDNVDIGKRCCDPGVRHPSLTPAPGMSHRPHGGFEEGGLSPGWWEREVCVGGAGCLSPGTSLSKAGPLWVFLSALGIVTGAVTCKGHRCGVPSSQVHSLTAPLSLGCGASLPPTRHQVLAQHGSLQIPERWPV